MTPEQRAALEAAQAEHRAALEAVANAADDADLDALEAEAERTKTSYQSMRDKLGRMAAAQDALAAIPELPPAAERAAQPEPQPARPVGRIEVGQEPLTYGRRQGAGNASFLRDLIAAAPPGGARPDLDAAARLQRHQQEMGVELRASSTTDTTSIGEMVPPLWLVEQFASIARAGRPLANAIGSRPLPVGTDTINVPKVTTGGSVHFQTAQNTAIASQDMVTGGTASATVKTIAGQIDTSLQSVEWSPINMVDSFFLPELASLHANIFETTIGSGAGTSGTFLGIIGTSGTNAVTYTSASPTAGSLYSKAADAIQQVHVGRYLPPDLVVMHPRRWAHLLAASDSTGRPLIVPNVQGPMNAMANHGGVESEGYVGSIQGLPVLVSAAAIPTSDASGTTNDVVLVMRKGDLWLWESQIRTRVLYEVLAGNLSVRIQLYNYAAFMPDRYPKAVSSIRGTGLSTPSF